jgi:HAE1 family hydrophobic/amphiphilic exporter-1
VLVSLFVAFTLDPMLSSRFSKTIVHGQEGPLPRDQAPLRGRLPRMDDIYRGVLGWALRHKLVVGALAIGSLVGTGRSPASWAPTS